MFEYFRSFFAQSTISGGLYVTCISACNPVDGYSVYVVADTGQGLCIGSMESISGNTGGGYDASANSALPVTVRLFGPTRNAAVTGATSTGFSAGTVVYLTAGGFASITGTITAGVTLQAGVNGNIVEIADVR